MNSLNKFIDKSGEKLYEFLSDKQALSFIIPLAVLVVAFAVISIMSACVGYAKTLRKARKALIDKKGNVPTAIDAEIAKAGFACVQPSEFFTAERYLLLPARESLLAKPGRLMLLATMCSGLLAACLSLLCYLSITFYLGYAVGVTFVLGVVLSIIVMLFGRGTARRAAKDYATVRNFYDQQYLDKIKQIYDDTDEEKEVKVDSELIAEIDRIYEEGDTLSHMKEVALQLQEERLKPEYQDSASQQALSAALNKLLKAMDNAINA